jgi:RNA polymerase-binding transcription factor DksA
MKERSGGNFMIKPQIIIANRDYLEQSLKRIEEALENGDEGSFRQGDEEWERGDALNHKQVAYQNHVHSKQMREDIIAALKRMDEGIYGICPDCGEEISEDRLIALPYAKSCIKCRQKKGLRMVK